MVLFLHNRYRTTGGEERVVDDLLGLVRDRLGEPAELLAADSTAIGRARAAAGLLRGGLDPSAVAAAVRRGGARVLHAHNLQPAFGWRALAAARAEGARVVLHLHQYRLVCAVGVCFTEGQECTRCHGRNTLPGIVRNCRGSRAEAVAYGTSLALWQRRMSALADAVIVPSRFALERLEELGAPLAGGRVRVLAPPVEMPVEALVPRSLADGGYALVVSRLAPEKGVAVAIDACRSAGVPLVIAGDGPELESLRARSAGGDVQMLGRVDAGRLAELRRGAAIALVPSRSAETFGMAAAEAMACGLPVAASDVGALPELLGSEALVAPGDPEALAAAIRRLAGDRAAGEAGRRRVAELCSPEVIAQGLREIYAGSSGGGTEAFAADGSEGRPASDPA
ncbi:MAG TPA: glycosyltransferase family 4 protein [Solirubrobacteraceae bacterium]|jgi:glycosyltransferase involved in cell wall biosynthesis|nr:glycosyltransferase family 4 protein [Solirubrobacteraceae bacterium]